MNVAMDISEGTAPRLVQNCFNRLIAGAATTPSTQGGCDRLAKASVVGDTRKLFRAVERAPPAALRQRSRPSEKPSGAGGPQNQVPNNSACQVRSHWCNRYCGPPLILIDQFFSRQRRSWRDLPPLWSSAAGSLRLRARRWLRAGLCQRTRRGRRGFHFRSSSSSPIHQTESHRTRDPAAVEL